MALLVFNPRLNSLGFFLDGHLAEQTPHPVHLSISTLLAFLRISTVKSPTNPLTFSTSLYVYNVDLFMCCCFYHLRSQDTCRTVQCREGLVQLGHSSADAGKFFYDIHFITCFRNIKGRLDSGNTSADDQCTLGNHGFRLPEEEHPGLLLRLRLLQGSRPLM